MSVMLVSGLWHGAGLNFLVWGAWHGGLLVTHRAWTERRHGHERGQPSAIGQLAAWGLTFASVTIGWAFFAMDLPTAMFYFQRLLAG